ncbi:hypothetical protein D1007_59404 [Hordeum vulgare]|nr:hypothetical protein D1007_59404 [Hordeum vulgare]
MDGQDRGGQGQGQRRKPDGNRNPKRGSIIKTIIYDLTGGGGGPATSGSGGGGGGGGGGGDDDTGNGNGS